MPAVVDAIADTAGSGALAFDARITLLQIGQARLDGVGALGSANAGLGAGGLADRQGTTPGADAQGFLWSASGSFVPDPGGLSIR